jgi:pimeloyl-ACP methyl ester carboxylesterase
VVNFYKANWPKSPVTLATEAFGFRYGQFPPVKAPTLFIYGRNSGPFQRATLNGMWEWVEGSLTINVLPGVGHAPHTEAPELVTPLIMEWLATSR